MTVYIDDMQREATVGTTSGVWSHLMADTTEELVEFAVQKLRLSKTWIQHRDTPLEHFDVTEPKRQMALKAGAVPISYGHEGAALTKAKREGRTFDLLAWRLEQVL